MCYLINEFKCQCVKAIIWTCLNILFWQVKAKQYNFSYSQVDIRYV